MAEPLAAAAAPDAPAPISSPTPQNIQKLQVQIKKLAEANSKYKNLLKLARERIEKTETDLATLQQERDELQHKLAADEQDAANRIAIESETNSEVADAERSIVRVCQRVAVPTGQGYEEIWALMEMETIVEDGLMDHETKRFKEWKRFDTESQLQDFIRRDTGEPLSLPPPSLSPEQSSQLQTQAEQQVAAVTEEFRRFRVKVELSRKQADAQIRDLQNNKVQRAAQAIERNNGHHPVSSRSASGGSSSQVEQLRAELAAQNIQWEEAYDTLLAENESLKSAGSEALLASQWRQRYEQCLKEKESLQARLSENDNDDYEQKYRDLKESFRLYRKKAKEIFESQQRGVNVSSMHSAASIISLSESASAESKLSYLRNLMVNYLTSEPDVREHMEGAIGTVLQFTPDDVEKLQKKKLDAAASWF